MSKLTLSTLASSFSSVTKFNANFSAIVAAFENTLSRDGTSPNAMGASIDVNSYRILNHPDPLVATDVATKNYIDTQLLSFATGGFYIGTVASLPGGSEGLRAFATNGRKVGQGAGSGTGVPVYFSAGSWRVYSTDAAVQV